MYPKVKVKLKGIEENTRIVCEKCKNYGIDVTGVTKAFCADENIAEALISGGVRAFGDSRVLNLKKLNTFNMEKWLIRIPMESEISDVIKYADVSLNSEIKTIRLLNVEAEKQDKIHKVVLMVDLGDLREGYFNEDDLINDVDKILQFNRIDLIGIGTNLTCYGGIIPTAENLRRLVLLKERIENSFNIELNVVSGGNSSSYTLIENGTMIDGISNLRLGEVILLGRETSYGLYIDGLHQRNFILQAQIVELKEKPSYPIGEIGMDAFGNKPEFVDKGVMKRGILAVGKQDIDIEGLTPIDSQVKILGGSSDHLLVDLTNTNAIYKLGDVISFEMDYSALLKAMTSEYVFKEII